MYICIHDIMDQWWIICWIESTKNHSYLQCVGQEHRLTQHSYQRNPRAMETPSTMLHQLPSGNQTRQWKIHYLSMVFPLKSPSVGRAFPMCHFEFFGGYTLKISAEMTPAQQQFVLLSAPPIAEKPLQDYHRGRCFRSAATSAGSWYAPAWPSHSPPSHPSDDSPWKTCPH